MTPVDNVSSGSWVPYCIFAFETWRCGIHHVNLPFYVYPDSVVLLKANSLHAFVTLYLSLVCVCSHRLVCYLERFSEFLALCWTQVGAHRPRYNLTIGWKKNKSEYVSSKVNAIKNERVQCKRLNLSQGFYIKSHFKNHFSYYYFPRNLRPIVKNHFRRSVVSIQPNKWYAKISRFHRNVRQMSKTEIKDNEW